MTVADQVGRVSRTEYTSRLYTLLTRGVNHSLEISGNPYKGPPRVDYDQIRQNTTKYDNIRQNTTKYDQIWKIRPNTTKYDKKPPNTTKYDQIRPNTTKYNQIRPNTTKYKQIRPHTTKCDQIPPNTTVVFCRIMSEPSSYYVVSVLFCRTPLWGNLQSNQIVFSSMVLVETPSSLLVLEPTLLSSHHDMHTRNWLTLSLGGAHHHQGDRGSPRSNLKMAFGEENGPNRLFIYFWPASKYG